MHKGDLCTLIISFIIVCIISNQKGEVESGQEDTERLLLWIEKMHMQVWEDQNKAVLVPRGHKNGL